MHLTAAHCMRLHGARVFLFCHARPGHQLSWPLAARAPTVPSIQLLLLLLLWALAFALALVLLLVFLLLLLLLPSTGAHAKRHKDSSKHTACSVNKQHVAHTRTQLRVHMCIAPTRSWRVRAHVLVGPAVVQLMWANAAVHSRFAVLREASAM